MRLGWGSFRTCCEYNQFICIMLCACHFICIICISTEQMQTKILEWHQNEINDFFVCLKWINSLGPNILLVNYWCGPRCFEYFSLDLSQGCVLFSIFLARVSFHSSENYYVRKSIVRECVWPLCWFPYTKTQHWLIISQVCSSIMKFRSFQR
jgi:hypothetical protein